VFESTCAFSLFDHYRIPYTRSASAGPADWGVLAWHGDEHGRALWWPRMDSGGPRAASAVPGAYHVGEIPIFGHVVHGAAGNDEVVLQEVTDRRGQPVAAIRRDAVGRVILPFDPGELTLMYWSEGYHRIGRTRARTSAIRWAKRGYYRLRPLLPRAVQIRLRRRFSAVQARAGFPRWPVEPALHDLHDLLLDLLTGLAGEPLPSIAPWPDEHRWALVLTHDVEHEEGLGSLELMRDIEARHGVRSSWNHVGRRYAVPDPLVAELLAHGYEVGVHGLHHDGRDISEGALPERLPEMRRLAARWHAAGFRSPATNRDWNVMRRLGFDYDSSYPDTDPFEPDAGGCCSWLPFFNGDTVELPITLPQDHTLWEILEHPEPTVWFEKAQAIAARGGMALLITHPDYMLAPERLEAYERFLERFAHDPDAWRALPRDVSAWWRRRAASSIIRDGNGWRIEGPAGADGRVELVGGASLSRAAEPARPAKSPA
jgi:hypothetical protein